MIDSLKRTSRSGPVSLAMVLGVEAPVAMAVALIFARLGRAILVDPLDRVGQVNGLAHLQLRFTIVAMILCALLTVSWRGKSAFAKLGVHVAFAVAAGLTTAVVGAGIGLALRGIALPLVLRGRRH